MPRAEYFVRARPSINGLIALLAGAIGAMHFARIAAADAIDSEALHPARFLEAQAQPTATAAGDQFRQAPSQTVRVDAERVAYADERQRT